VHRLNRFITQLFIAVISLLGTALKGDMKAWLTLVLVALACIAGVGRGRKRGTVRKERANPFLPSVSALATQA